MSEPTSKFNDLSSETVTKLVSIIVAIVVFAVVLVPIVNGLADGNGDGGNSGESEKVYLNTIGLENEIEHSNFPYKTYQVYYSSETPTLPAPIHYTLEDLIALEQSLNEYEYLADTYYCILSADSETDLFQINYGTSGEWRDFTGIGLNMVTGPNASAPDLKLNKISSFEITISTDYTYTQTITLIGKDPYTKTGTFTKLQSISTSEEGWVEPLTVGKFTVGSEMRIAIQGQSDSQNGVFVKDSLLVTISEEMFNGNSLLIPIVRETYSVDIVIEIESTDMEGVWNIAGNGDEEYPGLVSPTLQNFKDTQGNTIEEDDSSIVYLSSYGYTQSESGSGSSTDSSGISGTAGTILKIVPVLVGVGVILAIVALFYDPRNLIKKD